MAIHRHDVLIIGSGAAGLSVALHLPEDVSVALLSKGTLTSASTYYAQGGVAAVLDREDSVASHIADTHEAGAGLCHDDTVRFTVENGPDAIHWLIDEGVAFTRLNGAGGDGDYHLAREGGHSHRRIVHAADATGLAISSSLIDKVKARPNVNLYEHRVAVDLIHGDEEGDYRCRGAYIHNHSTGNTDAFLARSVVLATGGASKAYLYTSNPDVATGDGIAMAWRGGCRVANMEFMQFHPTCLYHPNARNFLVSEALRGEGATLLRPDGERFMPDFDERGELAPRDIVARAIDHEMKRLGLDCVYLDITHKSQDFIINHFPTVYAKCLQLGIDISRDPIPVVPAAHYTCGGVITDLNGCTDLPGLYAIGETAFTGLHGANRMASNSLLECIVFGTAASRHIAEHLETMPAPVDAPEWDDSLVTDSDEDVVIAHNWDELRRFMWDYVGIVRTVKRLERARHRIDLLKREIHEYYSNYRISNDLIELRNLVVVADLMIRAALSRHESRGLHYLLDYPRPLPDARDTVLLPDNAVHIRHAAEA
jgi:L-aspartate oxidase